MPCRFPINVVQKLPGGGGGETPKIREIIVIL